MVAVILAAGGGSRFTGDTHKLAAPFRGSTVLAHAVAAAIDAAIGPVVVVVGSSDVQIDLVGVEIVANARWDEGQSTSLQVAVIEADRHGADAVVIGLGDQPLVTPEAWQAVANAAGGPIVVASYDGDRRPPVRLDRDAWPLLPTDGDEGARAVMRRRPDLVSVVEVTGIAADIDTVEDLTRWS
jgi:CTP:molybdopterin cytidylyltransferase MocA